MLKNNGIEEYFVKENAEFYELLTVLDKKINASFGSGFAIIVNQEKEILGTVEDSDIRKFLLHNSITDISIKQVMRKNFIFVTNDLTKSEIIDSIIKQIDSRGWSTILPVKIIPVLKNNIPIDLIDIQEIELAIKQRKNNYVILGLGYVGLTLALTLAEDGRRVYGFDIDQKRVNQLLQNKSYIVEPGIDTLLKKHLNLDFHPKHKLESIDNQPGNQNIYIICVGTPLTIDKVVDLNPVWSVVNNLINILKYGDIIVMRSTIPIGVGNEIISFIESRLNWSVGVDFHYIAAPERTVEGNALKEIRDIPQIISGASQSCQLIGINIFRDLVNSVMPIDKIEGAELIKIISNAYRDYIFGFSNYFIEICQKYNLDINQIIEMANRGYPRNHIPDPSPGVGGPCLTKDSYFLEKPKDNTEGSLLILARKINENVPIDRVNFINRVIPNLKEYNCIGIGLAFKGIPETNDFRNSPSLEFLDRLKLVVKSIKVWDSLIDSSNGPTGYTFDSEFDTYDFFALLNNNSKNLSFFNKKIQKTNTEKIVIFDPWRLVKPNLIITNKSTNFIHYFSLSHHETVSI